jgi:hypothetical protein
MKFKITIICSSYLLILSGCTIKTPEVSFTSERTALERQILGTYQTIAEDAWMVSSTRSTTAQEIEIPESKKLVLDAFANRRFNADDIEDFKKDGIAGENTSGLLTILPTGRYNDDTEYRQLVDRIIEEENRDRKIIMTRIVEIHSAVNPLDHEAVASVFAKMNQDASPSGTPIQSEDGTWESKR